MPSEKPTPRQPERSQPLEKQCERRTTVVLTDEWLEKILWWSPHVLFASALVMAGYFGFVLVDDWTSRREYQAAPSTSPASSFPTSMKSLTGGNGIPDAGLSVIVEGTGKHDTKYSSVHITPKARLELPRAIVSEHLDGEFLGVACKGIVVLIRREPNGES